MSERPDEGESFFERVWAVVARVPPGRVTTYGDIAEHLGDVAVGGNPTRGNPGDDGPDALEKGFTLI